MRPFFDTAARWWGQPQQRPEDEERVLTVERLCGPGAKRVLDLGAGGGTTPVALASRGHSVTAVELSETRVQHARALLRRQDKQLDLSLLQADFYTADLGTDFDCVTYWNGFGVGTDADQRRLLRRVSDVWLAPGGSMILDVFSPWRWAREAGTTRHVDLVVALVNAIEFEPVDSRFVDRWWPADDEGAALTQNARCYTPPDLVLLVEGTGLRLARVEVDGKALKSDDRQDSNSPLWDAWEHRVQLVRQP